MQSNAQKAEEHEFKIQNVLLDGANNGQQLDNAAQCHQQPRHVQPNLAASKVYVNLQEGAQKANRVHGAAIVQKYLKRKRESKQLSQQLVTDAGDRKVASQVQIGLVEQFVSIKSDQSHARTPYYPPSEQLNVHKFATRPRATPLVVRDSVYGGSHTCAGSVKSEKRGALSSHNQEFINF